MIEKRLAPLRVLWIALFVSTSMLLVVLVIARHGDNPRPPSELIFPMALCALASAATSFFFPRSMLARAAKQAKIAFQDEPDEGEGGYRENVSTHRAFADQEAAAVAIMPIFHTTTILGMALAESVALMGFVLAFLGLPIAVAIPFFAVCWALQASKFPTLGKIVRVLEGATGAKWR